MTLVQVLVSECMLSLGAGYAYSGGGAQVLRVDVSADGGATWHEAALQADGAPPAQHYAWTLWAARLPVAADAEEVLLHY